MKPLHWTKIRDNELSKNNESLWHEIDDRGVALDTSKLEGMFAKPKKKKKQRKKKKQGEGGDKPKKKKANISFIGSWEGGDKRQQNINIALGRTKTPFEQIRKWILTMDEKALTEEQIKRFAELAPDEEEVGKMINAMKDGGLTAEDAASFETAESYWWNIHDIPSIKSRLELWSFKMSFDELVDDQQKKVNLLIDAHAQISESQKLKQILKVVLAVGNYLNSSNKNGEANGIKLEVLSKLEGTKGSDGGYSLLMYIYELINDKYPDSENIHADFTLIPEAAKQDIEALQGEIEKIRDEVKDIVTKYAQMQEAVLKAKEASAGGAAAGEEDQFIEVMDSFVTEAQTTSAELLASFNKSITDLNKLAISFGEKKSITIEEFFAIWVAFLASWGKAREAIRKRMAAEKKKQKLAEKQAKLKSKLEKRVSKQDVKKKGIIKSKQDVKDHQRRMTLVSNLVRKNVKQKKEKLSQESKLGLKSRHHSIVLQTLKYICHHCAQTIGDKMQASGEYCHKCWISPEDKVTGNEKLKQLKWLSSQKEDALCLFEHQGCCLEIKTFSNPLLSGLLEFRQHELGNGDGKTQLSSLSRTGNGSLMAKSTSVLKINRADSGGTLTSLLTAHRRGKTASQGKDYEAMGHTVTDTHFHQLHQSLQQWRKTEFDPATAPEMPSIALAKEKVKAMNSGGGGGGGKKAKNNDFGTGSTGNQTIDKYKQKVHGNRKGRKNKKNKSKVQFASIEEETDGKQDAPRDHNKPPGLTIDFKPNRVAAAAAHHDDDVAGTVNKDAEIDSLVIDLGVSGSYGNRGSHQAKTSIFVNGSASPLSSFRNSGNFNRHRKGSNSSLQPASPRSMARRRRSTIEHNLHMETFNLRDEQKEKMDNPDFIRAITNDFTNFGSIKYDAIHNHVGIVLNAQRMRKEAFIFLEKRLGPIESNANVCTLEPVDDSQETGDPASLSHLALNAHTRAGPSMNIVPSAGDSSDQHEQRRFLLTEDQLDALSSKQFLEQMVSDFMHFGTLNVHEDELILESKSTRTLAAIQKLERRLGAIWNVVEIVACMQEKGCSDDDTESRNAQLIFLNKMVQTVSSGGRFRKHRKHGKPAHRWVLVDKDRLYWKEGATAENQKTRSFNLAKIVAIQPGKTTSALKNADDVDEAQCFSIVSKKATLDLSGEDEAMVQAWIVYLTAFNRHYKQQLNAQQAGHSKIVD